MSQLFKKAFWQEFWTESSYRFKNNLANFWPLMLIYTIVMAATALVAMKGQNAIQWADGEKGESFFISFMASLIEDLAFFGALGILGLVLSTQLPIDQRFDERIRALVNSRSASKHARKFMKHHLKDVLHYASAASVRMTLTSINENIITVRVERTMTIRNMCRDVDVAELPVNVTIDTGETVSGSKGSISLLAAYDSSGLEKKAIYTQATDLAQMKPQTVLSFNVPKDGEAQWRLNYTIHWNISKSRDQIDNWFNHSVFRFTEDLRFELKSELNEGFQAEIKHKRRTNFKDIVETSRTEALPPQGKLEHLAKRLLQEDRLSIFLTKQVQP